MVVVMLVTAWNNGSHRPTGAGYGLRITTIDRDRYFDRQWNQIEVDLDGEDIATPRLSESFWNRCTELRSADVGRWLLRRQLAPWPIGAPPKLVLQPTGGSRFVLGRNR